MDSQKKLRLLCAPMQGFIEAPFRHFHAKIFSTDDLRIEYFTPFVRLEKSEPRHRDMRDFSSPLNSNHCPIPQIIFRNAEEFKQLVHSLEAQGATAINLNAGCPFVPQVSKGRGAGLLPKTTEWEKIADEIETLPRITFSIKMRLGIERADEWQSLIPVINRMRLNHITLHPRTASMQYCGDVLVEQFGEFCEAISQPVIYNGDIQTPDDIERTLRTFPKIAGVMAGRGLVARPSLFNEWNEGKEWIKSDRLFHAIRLHDAIFDYYCEKLSGPTQVLSKVKPLWDYLGTEFDRKSIKKIVKSGSLEKYINAVRSLRQSL